MYTKCSEVKKKYNFQKFHSFYYIFMSHTAWLLHQDFWSPRPWFFFDFFFLYTFMLHPVWFLDIQEWRRILKMTNFHYMMQETHPIMGTLDPRAMDFTVLLETCTVIITIYVLNVQE